VLPGKQVEIDAIVFEVRRIGRAGHRSSLRDKETFARPMGRAKSGKSVRGEETPTTSRMLIPVDSAAWDELENSSGAQDERRHCQAVE
jgi:hypothetical protein